MQNIDYQNLPSKVAVITGANGGIGRELVQEFSGKNFRVIACIRKREEDFSIFVKEIMQLYGNVVEIIEFDFSNQEEIESAAKEIYFLTDRIDVLVNNAGEANGSLFFMTTQEMWRRAFEVNFFGPVKFTQLIARVMQKKKTGSIVFISSIVTMDGGAGTSTYGSSKAAIAFLAKSLSVELASVGIRVNVVAPGLVETKMLAKMDERVVNSQISQTALKRVGVASEIAKSVLFLASAESSFITGQEIRVDGGRF